MSNPVGRPSIYSQELADTICEMIASGMSMRSVSRDEKMPSMATIFKWLRENEEFSKQYARATEERTEAMAEEIIDIADDGTNDLMTIVKGDKTYEVENKEVTNRSRLRVDTRKWIMSKMKPKKYGEKIDVTSAGERIESTPVIISQIKPRNVDAEPKTTEGS